ncbi:Caleosin related protein-domain-containing protein [Halteromyces radiatus]|uniref:Caleosin related protein-domain-containing protein n=1 Tax=Halteromyces radiatus TaxID=101107 RepID=UPI00221F6E4B|nr:Caleosin related protein-domain-containing protein [Halteromyces radiatus]KAI8093149.1 Caleosin related protein-domain-containing protein [Halteromyces radiatus]
MVTNDNLVATTTANAALEKHAKFWDPKNKGYITPVDAMFGFIHLGYGVLFSVTVGTFLSAIFSYATQDSWMPDPLLRTRTNKFQKDTYSAPYNEDGQLDLDAFDQLFSKYAKSDISGKTITLKELLEWNDASLRDPWAWSTNTIQWLATYLLVGQHGIVKREDIQAAYDGTLFYRLREQNKLHRSIQGGNHTFSSSSNLNVSGVMVPKSYIRQLESQLNNMVNVLPRSTVFTLETRLRNWLSYVQQQKKVHQPILKGVATPATPRRHPLFTSSVTNLHDLSMDEVNDHQEMKSSVSSSSLFEGGLTGVMAINLLDRPMSLTGVQGYHNDDNDDRSLGDNLYDPTSTSDVYNEKEDIGISGVVKESPNHDTTEEYDITGVRPEGEDYYRDTPRKDWLGSEQLTGVSPSPSTSYSFNDQLNNLLQQQSKVEEDDQVVKADDQVMTGVQPSDDRPKESKKSKKKKKAAEKENTKPLPTPSTEEEQTVQQAEQDDTRRRSSATPPFTTNANHDEEEEEEEDIPVSPTDNSNNNNEESIKGAYSRPSFPPLPEVVPSED